MQESHQANDQPDAVDSANEIRMDQIGKKSERDKGGKLKQTRIPVVTNEILRDCLTRPEESEDPDRPRERPKHPKIGRTAYKLDVYKQKTDARVEDLKIRMSIAKAQQDPEWLKLRKQLLA